MIYIFVVAILLGMIIFLLTSKEVVNNRMGCPYRHFFGKEVFEWDNHGMYKMFNPSITKYGEDYVLCIRNSNRSMKNFMTFIYGELFYKSYICFVVLSKDYEIKKVISPRFDNKPLEDPRIQYHDGAFYVSVTEFITDKNVFPALYIFDTEFNLINRVDYNRANYYGGVRANAIEKNWCPFVESNKLMLHTDSHPIWKVFRIYDSGNMENVCEYNSKKFFQSLGQGIVRCSTSWKPFTPETYLCGLHTKEICGFPTMRSILVEIDRFTLLPIRKTGVFCMDWDHSRIQFLSGLEVDEYNVYLTYGVGNYKTVMKKFPKYYIKSLLV